MALLDGKVVTEQVPDFIIPYLENIKDRVITSDNYFKYLKYKLITDNNNNSYPSLDKKSFK